jgi:metal-responsive CopG/Arc/MetJ family transcriptional regulator
MAGRPKQAITYKREVVMLTQELLDNVSEMAASGGFTGRSTVIRHILSEYFASKNKKKVKSNK